MEASTKQMTSKTKQMNRRGGRNSKETQAEENMPKMNPRGGPKGQRNRTKTKPQINTQTETYELPEEWIFNEQELSDGFRRTHEAQDNSLMKVIGEIGRLQAIEQELRSQSHLKDLETNFQEQQKENAKLLHKVASLEKQVTARDMQISNLEKRVVELVQETKKQQLQIKVLNEGNTSKQKSMKDMERMLLEREQVQIKADDNFAHAMEDLMEKQRQLEIKDREVQDRKKAVDLKEELLQQHAGSQERTEELQNLLWARDQQLWQLKQMQEGQQEYFLLQMRTLQAELQNYKEQISAENSVDRSNPSIDHMSKWNSDIPLLTEDMLVSVIKQILPNSKTRILSNEDKAKLDNIFLLPHRWDDHYKPMYGSIDNFLRKHPEVYTGVVYRRDAMEEITANGVHKHTKAQAPTSDKAGKRSVKFAKGTKSNPKKQNLP